MTGTAAVRELPHSDAGCGCFACVHPNDDNAGLRVSHRIRHEDFADWLGDRPVALELPQPTVEGVLAMIASEWSADPEVEP